MGRIIYFILVSLWATLALAYPTPVDLDGKLHRWPISAADPYVYFEVTGEESLLPLLSEISSDAAATWSSVEQSMIKLKVADPDNPAQITINYQTSITGGDMAAGYSIFDNVDNGVPRHCSITIAADATADTYNLTKTTTHEMGHCLGLGHSLIPESIMSYSLDKNTLSLSVDDKAVISRLYPADGSEAKLAPGCAIKGTPAHGAKSAAVLVMIFIPFAFVSLSKMMRFLVKN